MATIGTEWAFEQRRGGGRGDPNTPGNHGIFIQTSMRGEGRERDQTRVVQSGESHKEKHRVGKLQGGKEDFSFAVEDEPERHKEQEECP